MPDIENHRAADMAGNKLRIAGANEFCLREKRRKDRMGKKVIRVKAPGMGEEEIDLHAAFPRLIGTAAPWVGKEMGPV